MTGFADDTVLRVPAVLRSVSAKTDVTPLESDDGLAAPLVEAAQQRLHFLRGRGTVPSSIHTELRGGDTASGGKL